MDINGSCNVGVYDDILVECLLVKDDGKGIDLELEEEEDGNYCVKYTPYRAGMYKVMFGVVNDVKEGVAMKGTERYVDFWRSVHHVLWKKVINLEVDASMWKVNLILGELIDMNKSCVKGSGVKEVIYAGENKGINIQLFDVYSNLLKSSVGIECSVMNTEVYFSVFNNDLKKISNIRTTASYRYDATLVGDYVVSIKKDNEDILGSPIYIRVDPDQSDKGIVNITARSKNITAGKSCKFCFESRDKYNNMRSFKSYLNTIKMIKHGEKEECIEFKLSQAEVSIPLLKAGKNKIDIYVNNVLREESPYFINVVPDVPDIAHSLLYGDGLEHAETGKQKPFHIITRDKYGNHSFIEGLSLKMRCDSSEFIYSMKQISKCKYSGFLKPLLPNTRTICIIYRNLTLDIDFIYQKDETISVPVHVMVNPGIPFSIYELQDINAHVDTTMYIPLSLRNAFGLSFKNSNNDLSLKCTTDKVRWEFDYSEALESILLKLYISEMVDFKYNIRYKTFDIYNSDKNINVHPGYPYYGDVKFSAGSYIVGENISFKIALFDKKHRIITVYNENQPHLSIEAIIGSSNQKIYLNYNKENDNYNFHGTYMPEAKGECLFILSTSKQCLSVIDIHTGLPHPNYSSFKSYDTEVTVDSDVFIFGEVTYKDKVGNLCEPHAEPKDINCFLTFDDIPDSEEIQLSIVNKKIMCKKDQFLAQVGDYTIHILINGESIMNALVKVRIVPGAISAASCYVFGDALKTGQMRSDLHEAKFTIYAKDSLGNQLDHGCAQWEIKAYHKNKTFHITDIQDKHDGYAYILYTYSSTYICKINDNGRKMHTGEYKLCIQLVGDKNVYAKLGTVGEYSIYVLPDINTLSKKRRAVRDAFTRPNEKLYIKVSRDNIFESTYNAFRFGQSLAEKEISVQFINEHGIDAGGLYVYLQVVLIDRKIGSCYFRRLHLA